ncbi:MAG: hypothetical protein HQ541_15490, partial [Mariniphaga sp.]|nr:hypothetical protein [Mariniphaga sp.]
MNRILYVLVLFLLIGCSKGIEPVNKNANQKTKQLLNYLSGLQHNKNDKLISGIRGLRFEGNGAVTGAEGIYNATGQWVGLIGQEYCKNYGDVEFDTADEAVIWEEKNPDFIEHSQNGGIIRILAHFPNPGNERYGGLRDSSANIDAIVTEGTTDRKRWLDLLDEVAEGLHDLDNHGISAIYGP